MHGNGCEGAALFIPILELNTAPFWFKEGGEGALKSPVVAGINLKNTEGKI